MNTALSRPTETAPVESHRPLTAPNPSGYAPAAGARTALPDFALTPDYVEVFSDTFRISNLDMRKWWTRFIFAGGTLDFLNDEWQRFREAGNHVMTPEGLRLTALPHNGSYWPSGAIRSKPCFNISDGNDYFFEARARVPRGLGIWPGFWLAADQRPADHGDPTRYPAWPPEIDIMEVVNNGQEDLTTMLHLNAHVRDWTNNPQGLAGIAAIPDFDWHWNVWRAPFDFADDFHLFGCHYKRPICTWYCDRKFIAQVRYDWVNDDGHPSGPAHILAQLAIGGASWAGRHGVDNDAFPQSFDLDYIKVWQRFQQGVIGHDLLPR